jgi:4-hydroxyproline epimerase
VARSRRLAAAVSGRICRTHGFSRYFDNAWGGNWFFLIDGAPCAIEPANIPRLTEAALAVRAELARAGHRGKDGDEIDHIEFFVRRPPGDADSRNLVLCPGGAYDRSPCRTGTSAKLACPAAVGALSPGARWIQESVIGGRFVGRYERAEGGAIRPRITGRAWVAG